MYPESAIILKFEGTEVAPFLCISLTTDSPQEGGWAPDMKTLLKKVARIWSVDSNFKSVLYVIPHGPGADLLLALLRMFLMSLGLNGAILKGVKSSLSGEVGRCGNHVSCVKSTSLGTLYVD